MPNYCILRTCTNRDLKTFPPPNEGLSKEDIRCVYHFPFPKYPNEILSEWLVFVQKFNRTNAAVNTKGTYLCSLHFEEEDFVDYGKLSKDAVPTIPPPKFSAAIAYKFRLIPHLDSKLLELVNNFNLSLEELIKVPPEHRVSDIALKSKVDTRVRIATLCSPEENILQKNQKSCILRACRNHDVQEQDHRTHWHSIPSTENLLAKWTNFIIRCNRTHDFQPQPGGSNIYVCSLHFEKSCYLPSGEISMNAIPTIAPKFTAETAFKYHLIPHLESECLDDINDFDRGLEDLFHLTPGPLNPELDSDMLVDPNEGTEESTSPHQSPTHSESSLSSYPNSESEPGISASDQGLTGYYKEDHNFISNQQLDITEAEAHQEVSTAYDWGSSITADLSESVIDAHLETGRSDALVAIKKASKIQRGKPSISTAVLSDGDFSTPLKTIRSLTLVKTEAMKAQQRIKTLKQKLVQGRSQIKSIFFLLRRLKREGSVTHEAALLLLKGLEDMYVALHDKPNPS
ncbi:uncharacterized protein LOC113208779 [Frankliniella occidentalis]|uniref:Uncharacterized protein LOC113208779 n=1 Tax=Frankliniella occidentalis TaxID=133901 RepID=A0A6J1ST96_FRAOC|nr:uncharacterized protein LOC113208779 [Frankliniella occidentalis]